MTTFELNGEYIELYKLLKALALCGSGGEAKHAIDEGMITVNGVAETRRRYKVRAGDRLLFGDEEIAVVAAAGEEDTPTR